MTKRQLTDNIFIRFAIIIIALELVAVSINFFYAPAQIAAGGSTGIAILANELLGLDRALVVLIINISMIILVKRKNCAP